MMICRKLITSSCKCCYTALGISKCSTIPICSIYSTQKWLIKIVCLQKISIKDVKFTFPCCVCRLIHNMCSKSRPSAHTHRAGCELMRGLNPLLHFQPPTPVRFTSSAPRGSIKSPRSQSINRCVFTLRTILPNFTLIDPIWNDTALSLCWTGCPNNKKKTNMNSNMRSVPDIQTKRHIFMAHDVVSY